VTTTPAVAHGSPGRLIVRSIGLGTVQIPVVAVAHSDGLAVSIQGRLCHVFRWTEIRSYSMFEAQSDEDRESLVVHVGPYREELAIDASPDDVLLEWTSLLRTHGLHRVTVRYGFD